ncbi:MAG: hypothetical protein MI861_21625, partial [Pirellulales bacterium]|nr:hypothetical protein [Pirellulales bacterium]
AVTLTGDDQPTASFTAPYALQDYQLTFQVTISDGITTPLTDIVTVDIDAVPLETLPLQLYDARSNTWLNPGQSIPAINAHHDLQVSAGFYLFNPTDSDVQLDSISIEATPLSTLSVANISALVVPARGFVAFAITGNGRSTASANGHRLVIKTMDAQAEYPLDVPHPPACVPSGLRQRSGGSQPAVAPAGAYTNYGPQRERQLRVAGSDVVEGRTATISVSRWGGDRTVPITLSYATRNLTAEGGSDFQSVSGQVTMQPGETGLIEIDTFYDTLNEHTESFAIDVTAPWGEVYVAVVRLEENSFRPDFEVASAKMSSGVGREVFGSPAHAPTVRPSNPESLPNRVVIQEGESLSLNVATLWDNVLEDKPDIPYSVYAPFDLRGADSYTISYSTLDWSADDGWSTVGFDEQQQDYESVTDTIEVVDGRVQGSGLVTIPTFRDIHREQQESFLVRFDAPWASEIVHVFLEDSMPVARFANSSVHPITGNVPAEFFITEADFWDSQVIPTIVLDAPLREPVNIDYYAFPGTATAASDYEPISGTLTFAAGETSKPFPLLPFGKSDWLLESFNERFFLRIETPWGQVDEAMVHLLGDLPDLSVTKSVNVVGGNAAEFTVTLSEPYDRLITANYTTNHTFGTAVSGSDYIPAVGLLEFQPGETEKTVSVSTVAKNDPFWGWPQTDFFLRVSTAWDFDLGLASISYPSLIVDDFLEPEYLEVAVDD